MDGRCLPEVLGRQLLRRIPAGIVGREAFPEKRAVHLRREFGNLPVNPPRKLHKTRPSAVNRAMTQQNVCG